MSPLAPLYALILLAVIGGLIGVYRVLGTPSRLTPPDYTFVLRDVATTVGRAAARLRAALDANAAPNEIEDVATATRKLFQTGYYQTLRLRPSSGPDEAAAIREGLGRACEAYDWASRMIGSESRSNPMVLEAARRLLDAGDAELHRASASLAEPAAPAP